MRILAAALLLSACASNGGGRYLLITETHHGPLVWHKFETREECERASRESDPKFDTRCATAREAGRR